MKLDALGEFGLIDLIDIPTYVPDQLILGIGDDCAVLPFDDTQYQIVSCDLLTEDIHFIRHKISAYQLGYKAVAVNLSDVAAMGGKPVHILLSVALPPDYTVEEWQDFYRGVADICQNYKVNVIGGDTTSSSDKMTINVTVLGLVQQDQLHLRKDAEVSDAIFVTGKLGGSRAGLELILQGDLQIEQADQQHLLQCHCQPEPCCFEIEALNHLAGCNLHALNDISDGLLSECKEIAVASQVALILDPVKIPVDKSCAKLAEQLKIEGLQWAMTGGEDYQLVGTLTGAKAEEICQQYRQQTGKPITIIGHVEKGKGVFLQNGTERQSVQQKGYDHFGSITAKQNEKSYDALTPWTVYAQVLEKQLTELQFQEEQQRIYRHDLQNHLACLSGLLECGQIEKAQAYLKQMTKILPKCSSQVYSKRAILNILLNQKARQAVEEAIDLQISCEDGLLDFISDYDLCTLLGNLLDNGLEHSAGGVERYLYLDILRNEGETVIIRMENSCTQPPDIHNGALNSRKANCELHGKGMRQIQTITEHYQGRFSWEYDAKLCRFISQCVFFMVS